MQFSSPNFNPDLRTQISNYLVKSLLGCLISLSNLAKNYSSHHLHPNLSLLQLSPTQEMATPSFQLFKRHVCLLAFS